MSNTLRVVAYLKAQAGKESELHALMEGLLEPTWAEEGCVSYEMLVGADDPGQITFVEEWRSQDDLDSHLQTAHIEYAISRFPDLLDGDLDLRIYRKVG
jgi:quinol monooxygenase YgiN